MTVYIKGKLSKGDKLVFESNEKYIGSHLADIPLKDCIKYDAFSKQINSGTSDDIDKLFNKDIVKVKAFVYITNDPCPSTEIEKLISEDLKFSEDITVSFNDYTSLKQIKMRRIRFNGELNINDMTIDGKNIIDAITEDLVGNYLQAEITIL